MREGIILKIEIPCIDTFVEVDEEGRIELPQQKFSLTELKTIAALLVNKCVSVTLTRK